MLDYVKKCDKVFVKFHRPRLMLCSIPIHSVVDRIVEEHSSLPPRVPILLCKVKLFMRLKKTGLYGKKKKNNQSVSFSK